MNAPIPKLPKQGRIKPKYNARPSVRELAYHVWLMDGYSCACGCGGASTVVHHPLTRHPDQRGRRDHEFVVQMTDGCHRKIHGEGSEETAFPGVDFAEIAWENRQAGIWAGML